MVTSDWVNMIHGLTLLFNTACYWVLNFKLNKCELCLSIAIQQPSTELMSYFMCCQDWIKQIIANNIMVNSNWKFE